MVISDSPFLLKIMVEAEAISTKYLRAKIEKLFTPVHPNFVLTG